MTTPSPPHHRAIAATQAGHFEREIVPVAVRMADDIINRDHIEREFAPGMLAKLSRAGVGDEHLWFYLRIWNQASSG